MGHSLPDSEGFSFLKASGAHNAPVPPEKVSSGLANWGDHSKYGAHFFKGGTEVCWRITGLSAPEHQSAS